MPVRAGHLAKLFPCIYALQCGGVGLTGVTVVHLFVAKVSNEMVLDEACLVLSWPERNSCRCEMQQSKALYISDPFWSIYSNCRLPKKKVTSCGLCCYIDNKCS